MNAQDAKTAIIFINKVIASNNPTVAVRTLKKYGYKTQFDVLPADQIEKALLELYVANPSVYFSVIKEIAYRDDITNWTTSPETKQKIRDISGQLGIGNSSAKLSFSDIWGSLVNAFGGTTTTNPEVVTETSEPAIGAGTILIISLLGIAAIVALYFLGKK